MIFSFLNTFIQYVHSIIHAFFKTDLYFTQFSRSDFVCKPFDEKEMGLPENTNRTFISIQHSFLLLFSFLFQSVFIQNHKPTVFVVHNNECVLNTQKHKYTQKKFHYNICLGSTNINNFLNLIRCTYLKLKTYLLLSLSEFCSRY